MSEGKVAPLNLQLANDAHAGLLPTLGAVGTVPRVAASGAALEYVPFTAGSASIENAYFVSVGAAADGDGSIGTPFNDFEDALAAIPEEDGISWTLYVTPGDYSEQVFDFGFTLAGGTITRNLAIIALAGDIPGNQWVTLPKLSGNGAATGTFYLRGCVITEYDCSPGDFVIEHCTFVTTGMANDGTGTHFRITRCDVFGNDDLTCQSLVARDSFLFSGATGTIVTCTGTSVEMYGCTLSGTPTVAFSGSAGTLAVDDFTDYWWAPIGTISNGTRAVISGRLLAQPTVSPTWVAVGTRDSSGTTGSTPAYGTNRLGDLFVMIVAGRITSVTTPTGWRLVAGPNDQAGRKVYIFVRIAPSTGSEAGTVAVTLVANSQTSTIHTFRHVAPASPAEDVTTGGSATSGSTLTAPSITAVGIRRLALFAVADGTGDHTFADDISGESGGTWVLRDTFDNGTGSNSAYGLYTAALDSGGTISGGTSTVTGIDEHSVVGFALAGV